MARSHTPVITIDGPSASGKGTVSRILALKFGWHFLDSGVLYRLVGLSALRRQVPFDAAAQLGELARNLDVRFESDRGEDEPRIFLDSEDVSLEARGEAGGRAASQVAVIPDVREALLQRQRDFRQSPGLVADGRDMGTCVFPEADLKIFLTASAEERARRRYTQLKQKGVDVKLPELLADLRARDERDQNRQLAPLKAAPGAEVMDTTGRTIDDIVANVASLWEKQSLANSK